MCAPDSAAGMIDDGVRVRIVRYVLRPGEATGWHSHDLDYVIVPYGDFRVRVESRDAALEAEMKKEVPYFREKGAYHNVTNVEDNPISFLEIELK